MYIVDADRIKCKYCLQILKQDEMLKYGVYCAECSLLIHTTPYMQTKMEIHIQNVNKFVSNYSPKLVNIGQAINFLNNPSVNDDSELLNERDFDVRYVDMKKHGIDVVGKILMGSFIPRVVEIVKYSTLKKINKIVEATERDRQYLKNYWFNRYSYQLPDWHYVVHVSFITRKKDGYKEEFYSFPSSVFDQFYTLNTKKPIHETFTNVFTREEFFSFNKKFSSIIDLENLQNINNKVNNTNKLVNSSILTNKNDYFDYEVEEDVFYDHDNEEDEFYDDDYKQEHYRRYTRTKKWTNNFGKDIYYYYIKNEDIFLTISYYEAELILIHALQAYFNKNKILPSFINISMGRKGKYRNIGFIKINNCFNLKILPNSDYSQEIHDFINKNC